MDTNISNDKILNESKLYNAIKNAYSIVVEVNFTQNVYTKMAQTNFNLNFIPQSGIYSDLVCHIASLIDSDTEKNEFSQMFSAVNICNIFTKGTSNMTFEYKIFCGDLYGFKWLSFNIRQIPDDSGDITAVILVCDIDEQKNSVEKQLKYQHDLKMSNSRYKIILEQTNAAVFEWIRENDALYISDKLPEFFRKRFAIYKNVRDTLDYAYIHPDDYAACDVFLDSLDTSVPMRELICRIRSELDSFVWYKLSVTHIFGSDGSVERIVGSLIDVDEEKRAFETLRYRAEYDLLTGTFNMQKFTADAEKLLKDDLNSSFAIIRADIDRFKIINDIYGKSTGDEILCGIADMLKNLSDKILIHSRMSADVFVMLVKYNTREDIVDIINLFNEQSCEFSTKSRIKLSFGICTIEDRSVPITTLCDWAQLAVTEIKGSLIRNYAFYDDTLRERILAEKSIEDEMNAALVSGQFKLYLQPKYDIGTSTVIGSEALVRWHHPQKGIISPGDFISLFEKNGFIIKLDEYMWEQTCKLLRSLIDKGYEPLPVSINISRVHANNPDLYDVLVNLVKKYNLKPKYLELELTESAFLDDLGDLLVTLDRLQEKGFSLAMDDFGAGYSSLNMLKNVPIDIIKIDREFLNETVVTEKGKTVIRHTIAMARQLNMKVVAEGVENVEQAAFLLESGCSIAQGFYYSRPITADEFENLAYKNKFDKIIEPEINYILSQNQDIVNIMMEFENNRITDSALITADGLSRLKQAFVNVLNKYRTIIQSFNTNAFEINFNNNTVYTDLRKNTSIYDFEFSTYENVCSFILTHAKKCYIDKLSILLNVDTMVSESMHGHDIGMEYEAVINGREYWMRICVIPFVMDKQLERIIITITDITEQKCCELELKKLKAANAEK